MENLENKVLREPHGSNHLKIPFIFCMIDSDGAMQTIPYPPTGPNEPSFGNVADTVYGIELMVNPRTLSSNLSKLITRTQSMTSYIEEHWGEELDTVTIQGNTAAFVTGGPKEQAGRDTDIYSLRLGAQMNATKEFLTGKPYQWSRISSGDEPGGPMGLTVRDRRNSVSYVQFKRLIDFIRINGCMFDTFGLVKSRYYIKVSYGNAAYKGFFENIDITENATDPFRYQYTITFKSQETLYSYVNTGKNV